MYVNHKPQVFVDRVSERYKENQSLRIYEEMSELLQSRSNLEISLYSRDNTGYEPQRNDPPQDYDNAQISETKEQYHTTGSHSQPNELAASIYKASTGET